MRILGWVIVCWLPVAVSAIEVHSVRMWPAPDKTRVVLDVSGPVDFHLFTMDGPHRTVIDLKNTRAAQVLSLGLDDPNIVSGLRYARRNREDLRVVLDMRREVEVETFLLEPNDRYGHRLVVDLNYPKAANIAAASSDPPAVAAASPAPDAGRAPSPPPNAVERDLIIAVDAGHGGDDVGAIGASGAYEKDLALAMARELAAAIDATPGMRAVLVRDGDYYVSLRDRPEIARRARADLFVSLHLDSYPRDRRVGGSAVYVLSRNGATSEAARLRAERENSSDVIGGVFVRGHDGKFHSTLVDLSLAKSMESSYDAANHVLANLRAIGKVHKTKVERNSWVVLKSLDIPSIFIEMAFISNPDEERRFRDGAFRRQFATAIRNGIIDYFAERGRTSMQIAQRIHRVESGDSIIKIARRYSVTPASLMAVNGLASSTIRIGEVLRIP